MQYEYWPTEDELAFPEMYQEALQKAKEVKNTREPTRMLKLLKEAFEAAQTARSFVDMSLSDEFFIWPLPHEVKLLVLKEVGFDHLVFMDYCCKPAKPVSEQNKCESALALKLLEQQVKMWDPNATTTLKQVLQ